MKLYQSIIGLLLLVFLAGCEGNNTKAPESKLGNPAPFAKKSMKTSAINGKIIIHQRIALPKNTVITVTLSDTSIIELPALILSQKYYDTLGRQSPFPFELTYQQDEIRPNASIVISATASVDGELWFASDMNSIAINNDITKDIELELVPVR